MELDPKRWARIEAVFADAAELPPDRRHDFLDSACCDEHGAPDPALRDEVLALLELDDEATAFFDEGLEKVMPAAQGAATPGERIGPWRLVREVGRGGMGAVWLAERAGADAPDGFRQTAAIKLVRPGLGADVLDRFRAERRIMAGLQHRSIARLLDGGVAEDGRPYLALEYVEGEPITAFCDTREMDVPARLALFVEVAHAVGYAHQNLVVHRDLKPSNILVMEGSDGTPQPRLLDFGIAKLLEESGGEADQTQTDTWALTPDYAAPEQASGGAITTATDVYGLGVVLYELLTGERPIRVGRGSPAEVERAILESVPLRPSDSVRQSSEGLGIARHRDASPATLARRLRGDLDRIALKALRKEPGRRYHSAEDFARDVERHLQGFPVEARPDTVGYRLRTFARRHRAAVIAAMVVLLALVGGIGGVLWWAGRAAEERDRAVASRELLLSVLGDVDPDQTGGHEVSAISLLDHTANRLRTGLRDDEETRADVEAAIGKVYGNLGEFERAEVLQRSSLQTHLDLFGPGHPTVLQSQADLALLLSQQSRHEEAESLLRRALAEARRGDEATEAAVAAVRHAIGVVLTHEGRFAEAEPHLVYALQMRREALGEDAPAVAHSLAAMGSLLRRQGRLDEAETHYREAAAGYRALFGDDNPRLGSALNEIGVIRKNGGDYLGAERFYRQALAIFETAYGERHPEYALALSNLGLLLKDRAILQDADPGLLAEAEPMLMRSLEIYRDLHGDTHLRVAHTEAHVGTLHLARGHGREAERWFRQSLATHDRAATPAFHTARPYPLTGLGEALLLRGRARDAEPILREALDVRETSTPGHWRIVEAQSALAECLLRLGQIEEADRLLTAAERRMQEGDGEFDRLAVATSQRRAMLDARLN